MAYPVYTDMLPSIGGGAEYSLNGGAMSESTKKIVKGVLIIVVIVGASLGIAAAAGAFSEKTAPAGSSRLSTMPHPRFVGPANRPVMQAHHHQHNGGMRMMRPTRLLTAQQAANMPAPFPSTQLNTPNYFPNTVDSDLGMMPTASGGSMPGNTMGTHQSQTSESPFMDGAFVQSAGAMTPNSLADMTGRNAYLPNDAGLTEDGRDPQTGLPVFTPNKLRRSNMLGSYGREGFLRQIQDPLTGYRKAVGKSFIASTQLQADLTKRRAQFNADRAAGNDDPVLFNSSDWAYF